MQRTLILIFTCLISACSLNHLPLFSVSPPTFNKNPLLTTNSQHYLNWDRALTASVLLTKDYPFSRHMDAYIALYHPDILQLYQDDAALLALKKIKLRRSWISNNAQQRNQALLLQTNVSLGAYDNQRQAFPIQSLKLGNEQQTYQYQFTKKLSINSSFPESFYLYISNMNQLKQLKLAPDLARLLTINNIQQGHMNSLPVDIEVRINQIAGTQGQGLGAIMTRVIFYSDENREVPLRIDSFSVTDIANVSQ
ncbi:MAG: DUF4852 domain-containing protein [Moritella sp.]|uniref:DUF4852 domain-containing protein n=1 Tax=Moritella sp. TaxID=78556 RepID=UPI0025F08691|nr:DUF4852 domain-containing protein [Moritella sp.]NQZ94401.1 DUF4852 domain-containing protein [Moritella sp.]